MKVRIPLSPPRKLNNNAKTNPDLILIQRYQSHELSESELFIFFLLKQVGYPTALDIYTLICLCSVFAALVEYGIISFLTMYVAEWKADVAKNKKLEEEAEPEKKEEEDLAEGIKENESGKSKGTNLISKCCEIPGNFKAYVKSLIKIKPFTEMYVYTNTEEALDMIDEESKKYFPMVFAVMMVVYWTTYLYVLEDKILQQVLENNSS